MGAKQIRVRTRPGRGDINDPEDAHLQFLENYDAFKAAIDAETPKRQEEIKAAFEAVNEEYADGMFDDRSGAQMNWSTLSPEEKAQVIELLFGENGFAKLKMGREVSYGTDKIEKWIEWSDSEGEEQNPQGNESNDTTNSE